jgi:predicted amidohydrolase
MRDIPQSAVRTAIGQLSPVLGDVTKNKEIVVEALHRAKQQEADLVVFPELFLTGYFIEESSTDLTGQAGDAIDDILPHTEELVVVLGTPTSSGGKPYNSAVVLQDGAFCGAYNKTHLYGSESATFRAGDAFPTFETDIGTLGIEICYDLEFPEVARQLTLNGAEFIITISANMRPCRLDQELYQGARALENFCPHVLCNRVGKERDEDFFGESGIVNERGRPILTLGADQSEITSAAIPLDPEFDKTHDYFGDRRSEIYVLQ